MTLIIICETEIREINTFLAIQCMQACTRGCNNIISTDLKRNNTPFVLNISQRSSEGRISAFGFLTHVNFAVMDEAPAPGVQVPQPLVNPPQVPQLTILRRQWWSNWPTPQPVQFNVANAQDEFEINFGIPVSLSLLNILFVCYFGHRLWVWL